MNKRTDFKSWGRDTLEKFAREVADENKAFRADAKRLDWMDSNQDCELSQVHEDEHESQWAVHRVNGSRNDRQWNLIGTGPTTRAAVDAAMKDAL